MGSSSNIYCAMNRGDAGDGTYGLSSLFEKTRKSIADVIAKETLSPNLF